MKMLFSLVAVAGLTCSCDIHQHLHAMLAQESGHTAQTANTIVGTVTEFKTNSFEMGVKPDTGETRFFPFGTDTEVVQVPPGEHDLARATHAAVTDILAGDRVMLSFVPGMAEARRIVLISSRDIAKRNEAVKLDWRKRGISAIAVSQKGKEITLEIRTPEGPHTAIVTVTEKTRIRRYAPDSVKFTDAAPSTVSEIAPGDQVRARGSKSEDGSRVDAEDVVFGTFLTRMGTITAVNREAGEIRIQEAVTKKPLTIRVAAGSQLKRMAMQSHEAPSEKGFDVQATMEQFPAVRLEDLKVGGSVVVTSTKGVKSDAVTAILLIADADFLVQMAGTDAIRTLHGGMLAGPDGLTLPTMIQ